MTEPGPEGFLRFPVKMSMAGAQTYPMDADSLGGLRRPDVVFGASAANRPGLELEWAVERVRAMARSVNIPTEQVDAAIAAELEWEFERGRTTTALASPLDAIERVRDRIYEGDSLAEPLAPRPDMSNGDSTHANPLAARLISTFERLGYEDPAETAYAIARTVNRWRSGGATP